MQAGATDVLKTLSLGVKKETEFSCWMGSEDLGSALLLTCSRKRGG